MSGQLLRVEELLPDELKFHIEDGVATVKLAGKAYLTITPVSYRKSIIVRLSLHEGDEEPLETEVPINRLEKLMQPKHAIFRAALQEHLPEIVEGEKRKRLPLNKFLIYLSRVMPQVEENFKNYLLRLRERKRERKRELLEQHKRELEPIMREPVRHIMEVLDYHHVGDDVAKHQLLTVVASRFLPRDMRLHAVIQGPSSSGKNNLVNALRRITPAKWWLLATRLTRTALDYLPNSINRKILYIQEYEGLGQASYSTRITLSEGRLVIFYTRKNSKTGELETVKHELTGTPVLITTTTALKIDEDMENRTFYINPDTSESQTERILEAEIEKVSDPSKIEYREHIKNKERLIKLFFESLYPIEVYIPSEYARKLAAQMPRIVRARRDFKKLLSALAAMAALHQHVRGRVTIGGKEYVVASEMDYEYVARWLLPHIKLQAQGVRDVEFRVFKCVKKLGDEDPTIEFTARDEELYKCLGVSYRQLKRLLDHMVENGLLEVKKDTRPYRYRFTGPGLELMRAMVLGQQVEENQAAMAPSIDIPSMSHDQKMQDTYHGRVDTFDMDYVHIEKDAQASTLTELYEFILEKLGGKCVDRVTFLKNLVEEYGIDENDARKLVKHLQRHKLVEERSGNGEGVSEICI